MEPLSLIALSAVIGGAAGKFVEKAWDSGEKWINSFFQNHREKALVQAKVNAMDFLSNLAERVKILEESRTISKDQIESAQEHPDFSILLQKAILSSSQTDSEEKHFLLARFVSERLGSSPESVLSLASKIACDAISYTNIRQLKALGLLATVYDIRPNDYGQDGLTSEQFYSYFKNWLVIRLKPFQGLRINKLDMLHLESLSCLKWDTFITRDLAVILSVPNKPAYIFNLEDFKTTGIGKEIHDYWENNRLNSATLTSVGQLIGVYVSDLLTKTTTTFHGWDE